MSILAGLGLLLVTVGCALMQEKSTRDEVWAADQKTTRYMFWTRKEKLSRRLDETKKNMLKGMSDPDLAALAAYFSSLK